MRSFSRSSGRSASDEGGGAGATASCPTTTTSSSRRPTPTSPKACSTLNGEYAQCFNRFHGHDGHVFQGRYYAVLVESEWHLAELSRYLALNPVRAGLVRSARHWRWSSYRTLAEGTLAPRFLAVEPVLAFFGHNQERARQAFVDFVEGTFPLALPGMSL